MDRELLMSLQQQVLDLTKIIAEQNHIIEGLRNEMHKTNLLVTANSPIVDEPTRFQARTEYREIQQNETIGERLASQFK